MKHPFNHLFVWRHILTPIAIIKWNSTFLTKQMEYRTVHIFGLRIAYWTIL